MSSLIEQAIIDAKELREAALLTAESQIVEKYAGEIKEAMSSLLEQPEEEDPFALEDPLGGDELGAGLEMGAEEAEAEDVEGVPDAAMGASDLCPCPEAEADVEMEFTLGDLKKMADEMEMGEPEAQEDLISTMAEGLELTLEDENIDLSSLLEDLDEAFDPYSELHPSTAASREMSDEEIADTMASAKKRAEEEGEEELDEISLGKRGWEKEAERQEKLPPSYHRREPHPASPTTDTGETPTRGRRKTTRPEKTRYSRTGIHPVKEEELDEGGPTMGGKKEKESTEYDPGVDPSFRTQLHGDPRYDKEPTTPGGDRRERASLRRGRGQTRKGRRYENLDEDDIQAIAEELTVKIMDGDFTGWAGRPEKDIQYQEKINLARLSSTEAQEEIKDLQAGMKKFALKYESLEAKNTKLVKAVTALKEKLDEVTFSNAKLLFQNEALTNTSLNRRQKEQFVESIRRAESANDAKVIYETLQSTVPARRKTSEPESLNEAIRRPSHTIPRREIMHNSVESGEKRRFQILAGIQSNKQKGD
jgi:hypothetical protein